MENQQVLSLKCVTAAGAGEAQTGQDAALFHPRRGEGGRRHANISRALNISRETLKVVVLLLSMVLSRRE